MADTLANGLGQPRAGGAVAAARAIDEEALRRSGRNVTRETFIYNLETMRDFVPGTGLGFPVSFTRADHEGTKRVVMARLNGRLQWELLTE